MSSRRTRRHVTIREVAERAGVSAQTVSRVLNGRPDVSRETRTRVQQMMAEMGYAPNVIARNLSRGRSYTLGVVTAGLKFIGPSRTLNAITRQAEDEGYTLLLKELPSFATDHVQPILGSLLSNRVDGIIWAVPEVGRNRDWLADDPLLPPVPILFATMAERRGLASISIDNYLGGRIATEHLLQQGYRHIGHISGPLDWWEARQRKQGWCDALVEAGMQPEARAASEGNWSSASGVAAFRDLLDQYPEMDAVFVANDQMALSVLYVALQEGIRVPQDLGVVGFDNLPESAYYFPPLTSVDQDLHQLGCQAVKEIVRIIEARRREEPASEPVPVVLTPQLVIRESSIRRPC